ncbi:M20 family metallopeptidase [Neiella marina]|uniref:M20 family metallopeptidase n=1 Tax=Neiella holothuriorum TaxID=2870530 RepID=A0ABS7EKF8_9GAMM|nr:M20 family metallopeptidase [Neiella holothuriorum]MBW8192814.1 M20 family metallopeptidase [Neiella holothuriorum]
MDFKELSSIIELNSHTRNKSGVDENGIIFSSWMTALGFKAEIFERDAIGNHIKFFSQSSNERDNRKRILLLGHLDTVFPINSFTDFREDEEWIYGPGVCDMKGGNYIALCALRRLHAELGEIRNIDMLLVSDEETGSDDSKYLTAELAKDYDACLVFEAAGPNHEVVIGRKGVGTFKVQLTGKGAHAGNHYADGCNANLAAAHLLVALQGLTDLAQGTTVNVGKMSGGIGANTISPSAELLVEMRYTQTSERDRVLAELERLVATPAIAGVKARLSGGIQRDVMQPSSAQAQLLATIESVLGYSLPTEQRGGVSDANIVAAAGVPTLDGFGPFGDGDHTPKERALKASFERRIDETTQILRHFEMARPDVSSGSVSPVAAAG